MELYVVKMNRWGDEELHSYVIGVYDDPVLAEKAGDVERLNRDNKYEPEIIPLTLNQRKIKKGP